MERRFGRHIVAVQKLGRAVPSDLDAAIEIGLRARHLEQALGLEMRLGAKDLRIRLEAHARAALVWRTSDLFQLAFGMSPLERHPVMSLLAPDVDLEPLRQGVGDRHAN